jgi:hypothetical protein
MNQRPEPPPEGRLIAAAADRHGFSIREAARRAGLSYGRWRQIVQGYQNVSPGEFAIVRAPARTLAKMAQVVGITPEQMEGEGQRPDVADILRQGTGVLPPAPDPAWRPEPVPGGHFSVLDVAAAEPFAAVLREQYDELRAAGVADPDGAAMFPAHDTVPAAAGFAAAWDAAMMYAPGPDEENRVTQVIWMTALYQARREARLNEQGNADSALTSGTALPVHEDLPFFYRSPAGYFLRIPPVCRA